MASINLLDTVRSELSAGLARAKCQQCGGMRETLDTLQSALPDDSPLADQFSAWKEQLKPVQYAYLDCTYCFSSVALDAFQIAMPDAGIEPLPRDLEHQPGWPPIAGDYILLGVGEERPVAVVTLASADLVPRVAALRPPQLCLIGGLENENVAIDRLVKNVVSNAAIRAVIVAGNEKNGHRSGQTLLALRRNGVDDSMRVIGSSGQRPILRHVTRDEVAAFRQRVEVFDLIGCETPEFVAQMIDEVAGIIQTGSSGE